VTDLERFFRQLVRNLASSDPARLDQPIPLQDVLHSIVPYRTNRRALQLESSEDYELVVMRLCAGEEGLVRTDPEEARSRFAKELASPNPDLAVLHQLENVVLALRSTPLARALGPETDLELAPKAPKRESPVSVDSPELPDLPELPQLEELPEAEAPAGIAVPHCLYCGAALPTNRSVNFCPHCGQNQRSVQCPDCRTELEPGWRHCVNCGAAVSGA
jgi:predicted nucleic acid-binding Zn ribbon protein